MKTVSYIIHVVQPNQETGYIESVSAAKGTFTTTKNKTKAKHYKNEDYAMYDLDLLATYVMQGYNFYYDFA